MTPIEIVQTVIDQMNQNRGPSELLAGTGVRDYGPNVIWQGKSATTKNRHIEVVRCFSDGDFVVAHSQVLVDQKAFVALDIFHVTNQTITEHWGVMNPLLGANPAGRTQLDGETEFRDFPLTAANKAVVSNFVHDEMMQERPGLIQTFFNAGQYIQHNHNLGDGIAAVIEMRRRIEQSGGTLPTYTDLSQLLGAGNFVLAVTHSESANKTLTLFDLFRLENEEIVEHWDVFE
ncbi:hypothetical protein [Furfurilactobacillus entadae]|uniref:hypothetical protein n=1 Tax=Furfurilactobacillus entadae TaxID=2922307 RepID=UPI0035E6224A